VKKWQLVVGLLTLAVALAPLSREAGALCVAPGQPAPNFSARSLEGGTVQLSDFRGKVVLVTFWSSWCSRCQEELAYLKQFDQAVGGDLVVLAVNQEAEGFTQEDVQRVRQAVAEWGLNFPVLLDEQLAVWEKYCLNALPTSVIVDREGRVHYAEPNFYWASEDQISGALKELGVL